MRVYGVGREGLPVNMRVENEQGETLSISFYTEQRDDTERIVAHYRPDGGIATWPKYEQRKMTTLRDGCFNAEDVLTTMADFMGYRVMSPLEYKLNSKAAHYKQALEGILKWQEDLKDSPRSFAKAVERICKNALDLEE